MARLAEEDGTTILIDELGNMLVDDLSAADLPTEDTGVAVLMPMGCM